MNFKELDSICTSTFNGNQERMSAALLLKYLAVTFVILIISVGLIVLSGNEVMPEGKGERIDELYENIGKIMEGGIIRGIVLLIYFFSSLAIEDLCFIFIPLVFMNVLKLGEKTKIVLGSLIFTAIHLLVNNVYSIFYLIPMFLVALPHLRISIKNGIASGIVFHIAYDLVLISTVILVGT